MGALSYAGAGVPVREDLPAAHEAAWAHIASPGSWWSGAERVAIAAEVRSAHDCGLCAERKAAALPASVPGEHGATDRLSATAVDAVHRITTDPGRLSRVWFEKLQAGGLAEGRRQDVVRAAAQRADPGRHGAPRRRYRY